MTTPDIDNLKSYLSVHSPSSFDTLSEYNRLLVLMDIQYILQEFNPSEIWLTGSYARGTEINSATPLHIKGDMMKFRQKQKNSDRDYYIFPTISDIIFDGDINILPTKPKFSFQIY
jgi:hypothetical protein